MSVYEYVHGWFRIAYYHTNLTMTALYTIYLLCLLKPKLLVFQNNPFHGVQGHLK